MVRVVVSSAQSGCDRGEAAWLGAKLQAVTPEIADSLDLKRPSGALVAKRRRRKSCGAGRASRPAISSSASTARLSTTRNAFDYRFATKPLGGAAQVGLIRQGKSSTCRSL